MTVAAPSPPISPDIDLRDFAYMPLDVVRLRDSDTTAVVSGEAFRAAVILWCVAWHQVPAASLPNEDRALARLAGFGRDLAGWQDVKAEALRGFALCSDGRLYHGVIAEKARDAWEAKMAQRARTAAASAARAARQAQRDEDRDDQRDVGRNESRDEHQGKGREGNSNRSSSLRSEDHGDAVASPKSKAIKPRTHPFPTDGFGRWYADYPHKVGRAAAERAFAKVRASDAVAFDTLVSGLARYRLTKPPDRPWCNPATWLNEGRWADQPASATTTPPAAGSDEASIALAGGNTAKPSAIRDLWSRGRWPNDWGPDPTQPGCWVPPEKMAQIMGDDRRAA